jgi:glycosyltransferase involved in cell wall biosynthesis
MNIAIMGGWNTDSGASLHSELIGRSFIDLGHSLRVFTFYEHAFHGSQLTGTHEEYVVPCFTHSQFNPVSLNVVPFLTSEYSLFIAEDIGMLPKDHLAKIFNSHIRKKAKVISVYHDNQLSQDPSFYQFDWDGIVCFDRRYFDILSLVFPKEKINTIAYPCMPWSPGDQEQARAELQLPKEEKIVFSFGVNSNRILEVVEGVNAVCDEFPVLLCVLSKDALTIKKYHALRDRLRCTLIIREEAPSINRVYQYLHAADAMLYFSERVENVVVASTILQTLGAGCAIIGNRTRYTEGFTTEIFKYTTPEEMAVALREVFTRSSNYRRVLASAKRYTQTNSSREIAGQFIDLYCRLKRKKGDVHGPRVEAGKYGLGPFMEESPAPPRTFR